MRRALAAVLALAALAASVLPFESEARDRRCRRTRNGARTDDCVSYAFFEAFPTSGAGTTSACSTTAPTGAKGEALTFTRGSTAYCTKTASGGLATTGIAEGELVSMANGVARVEYDSAGVLGLRVEGARTNSLLYSQQIDNAAWTSSASGVATPTITQNAGIAPDGTLTAERIQVPSTTGSQFSFRYQSACPANNVGSFYAKSLSGAQGIDFWIAAGGSCFRCNITDTSWTRCVMPQVVGNGFFVIGNDGTNCGSGTRAAIDALVWQAQCEAGAYATSPILTTTAAQTRAADTVAQFPVVSSGLSTGSAAFSWTAAGTGTAVGQMSFSGNARMLYGSVSNLLAFDGTNNPSTAANGVAGTGKRYWSSWSTAGGWVVRNDTDANQATSAFNLATWTAALDNTLELVGVAGIQPDGIISRVCLDPDTARCR